MKELSIEEKAKRYDEAIAKGRQIQNTPYTAHWDTMKEVVEHLFPELKDSEDERIRKEIINYFKCQSREEPSRKDIHNQWIAWLKKQGEQKVPINDFKAKNWYVSEVDGKIHDMTYNPADKVEPKFKVGDVIRNKWSNRTKTITAIDNSQYILDDGMPAQPLKVNINAQDNWELVEPNPAWSEEDERIYKVILEILNSWSKGTIGGEVIPPNTDRYINWFKSFKDRVQPQPKQEWSEKDEKRYTQICVFLQNTTLKGVDEVKASLFAWLKDLKERYTWKPSNEQIKAIRLARAFVTDDFDEHPSLSEILVKLEEQLEKLKG